MRVGRCLVLRHVALYVYVELYIGTGTWVAALARRNESTTPRARFVAIFIAFISQTHVDCT